MTDMESGKPTITEAIEGLTGYDEIAIEKAFGKEFGDLSGTRLMRALAFVQVKRRDGGKDQDAYATVMQMTGAQVVDMFQRSAAGEVVEDFS